MATIVDRPISAMSHHQHSDHVSRGDSVEIIDVDSYVPQSAARSSGSNSNNDVEIVSTRTRPRPRQRGSSPTQFHEIINLVDDDDEEDDMLSARALSGHDANRHRSYRRLISPHPIASSSTNPPPVPQVPARYAGHTSMIFRRNTPSYPTPPVAPNPEPFAFEQSPEAPVAGPSNLQRRIEQQAAAPRSRHVPALGFGGALLSSNRVQPVQSTRMSTGGPINRRRAPQVRNIRNFNWLFDEGDEVAEHIETVLAWSGYDHEFLRYRGHLQSVREKEQYQQHYTHPPAPEPGFTFDFAPPSPEDGNTSQDVSRSGTPRFFPPTSIDDPIILDDDEDDSKHKQSSKGKEKERAIDSSSQQDPSSSHNSKQLKALLVCANCLDPLVLNAGLAPEEAENRRVWGLRCGHLIDEKCLNLLGKPVEANSGDEDEVDVVEKPKDRKGKGKAKAGVAVATPPSVSNGYTAVPDVPPPHAEQEVPADSSIRSRLRSSFSAFVASSSTMAATATAAAAHGPSVSTGPSTSNAVPPESDISPTTNSSPVSAKRRRGPNKRQSKKVQETFEWKCPVATCGRVHISVKINGIWGPEKERTAKGVKGLQAEARGAVVVFA